MWSLAGMCLCLVYKSKAVWPVSFISTSSKYLTRKHWSMMRRNHTFIWKMFMLFLFQLCEHQISIQFRSLFTPNTNNKFLWEQVHDFLVEGAVWMAAEWFLLSCCPKCSEALQANILWLLGICSKVVGCSMEDWFLSRWTKYSLRPARKFTQDLSHVLHNAYQLLPCGKHY